MAKKKSKTNSLSTNSKVENDTCEMAAEAGSSQVSLLCLLNKHDGNGVCVRPVNERKVLNDRIRDDYAKIRGKMCVSRSSRKRKFQFNSMETLNIHFP